MAVTTTKTNKPINPRGNDQSPKGYNRAALYSGKALDFDGVNDLLTISDGINSLVGSQITLTAWVRLDAVSGYPCIISNKVNTADGFAFLVNPTGNQLFWQYDGTAYQIESGGALTLGELYFVCATYDGSNLKTYINGVESVTKAAPSKALTATGDLDLYIGRQDTATGFWNGLISGLRAFNVALTAAQVADLYNNPEKIVPTGVEDTALKLWLPMMEGAGTTAYDGSGNGNHGTISGATWTHGIGAPVAQTAVIDWNKYSITDTTDYATASSSTIANEGTIVFKHVPLANISNTYFFSYGTNSTGQSRNIRQYNNTYEFIGWGSPNVQDEATSEAVEVGVIKNVAYTWDASGNVKVYIDGSNVLDTTLTLYTLTSSKIGINIAPTHTGQISNQIMFYAGLYDEVLTESQIQDIQNGTTNPESVSGLVHFWRNSNDWQDEVGSADLTENDNAGKVLFPQTLTDGRDLAGNIFANVRKQGALNLDGNSWAEVHDNASLDLTTSATLECWYKWGSRVNAGLVGRWDYPNNQRSILILHGALDNARLLFSFDGTNASAVEGTSTPAEGTWVHIAGTYDGTTFRLYVNATQEATASSTGVLYNSPDPLEIGRHGYGALDEINGSIAQPRIYNRALTAEEVERNYNAGKNIYS